MNLTFAQTHASAYAPSPRLDRYFESEVLNADPVRLITLLYRGAGEAITAARAALAAGNIGERSKQILKAWEIVHELDRALNREQGGDLARQLGELYGYVGQRLLDANAEQADKPLAEAGAVMATLAEAWQTVAQQHRPASTPSEPLSVAC
jgi:flagellar protein FliS